MADCSLGPTLRSGLRQPAADVWLPLDELRRLRLRFLRRARNSRRYEPAMAAALFRVAVDYGRQMRTIR